jgi:hypothetical protein
MEDMWTVRDLPVLKAAVKIYIETGRTKIPVEAIQKEAGFDPRTTQLALRRLYREPYFDEGIEGWGGGYTLAGEPTSAALRIAGAWPTPENLVDRLIEAFEAAANNEDLPEHERTRAQKIWEGLKSGGSKIAIAALGSAGGHILYS